MPMKRRNRLGRGGIGAEEREGASVAGSVQFPERERERLSLPVPPLDLTGGFETRATEDVSTLVDATCCGTDSADDGCEWAG